MIDTKMLKAIIDKKHISISELGKKSGVAKSLISELIRNKRNDMTVTNLIKLANALEVDINLLIK